MIRTQWISGNRLLGAMLALVGVMLASTAAADSAGDTLQLAIVVSRHGVRSPLMSNEALAPYASKPWPKWEVAPGIQTPHGDLLIAQMGEYFRIRFTETGLLTGNPDTDRPRVFIRADNDQRTLDSAEILGKALVAGGEPDLHALGEGTQDPLFQPFRARVGHPDRALAAAAVLGRLGGDPHSIDRAYALQIAELKGVLFGNAPTGATPLDAPSTVTAGEHDYLVDLGGPLRVGLVCADTLLLEYADGKPDSEVGWGRVDGRTLTDLLAVHSLAFDLAHRTRYPAQVEGSNMASHILDTLEQGAEGDPVPGALGEPGERLVVIVGHDTTLANLGGLWGLNWWLPGSQANPMYPGGALVFELWRRPGADASYFVRVSYVAQTLEEMRGAEALTRDHPPAQAPIFVPGCSGTGPNFDAPLPAFVRQARHAIDPAFVVEEP